MIPIMLEERAEQKELGFVVYGETNSKTSAAGLQQVGLGRRTYDEHYEAKMYLQPVY